LKDERNTHKRRFSAIKRRASHEGLRSVKERRGDMDKLIMELSHNEVDFHIKNEKGNTLAQHVLKDNAEFICKAVNNFEEMKKNLQFSTEILYVFKKHYADSQGILEGINIQIANNEQTLEEIDNG
jgi:hypothetical protein